MRKLKTILLLITLVYTRLLMSQGISIQPLKTNPIANSSTKAKSLRTNTRTTSSLELGTSGIIDNFSDNSPLPNKSIWLDEQVYISRGFGKAPITLGVAVFDGLNDKGYPYNFFVNESSSSSADSLTSQAINLDYPPADSIYLSFYIQPQGFGLNQPEETDSLVLDFKAPDATTWDPIWSQTGSGIGNDSAWKLIMIPITNSIYLKDGFQFRFRNYATVSGNVDQWLIDNVYLNKSRNINDTIFNDVSWVYGGESLLEKYRSMPWAQFNQSELVSNSTNLLRNNFNVTQNVNYSYKIYNNTTPIDSFNGSSNILAFNVNKEYTDCDVSAGCIKNAPITSTNFPSSLSDSTNISIEHYFTTGSFSDFSSANDTLLVNNIFSDYYAYDDGTAEATIHVEQFDGKMAVPFTLNVSDTATAIDIYFNPFLVDAELYGFILSLWDDDDGKPGNELLVNSQTYSPVYARTGQNIFTRYFLSQKMVLAPGTYYIGFTQKTDADLNVGLDLNSNPSDQLFYNVGAGWDVSPFNGAVMMRPVLRGEVPDDVTGINDKKETKLGLSLYPNPTQNSISIVSNQTDINGYQYTIADISSSTLLTGNLNINNTIDVSSLADGIYLITVYNDSSSETLKFIKAH